jgi:hypothetical protein
MIHLHCSPVRLQKKVEKGKKEIVDYKKEEQVIKKVYV